MNEIEERRTRVKRHYGEVAKAAPDGSTCCDANYSEEELSAVPKESRLGQGSGNPVRAADPQPGEVVVDLGSGAGIDVFLAASRVGPEGRVIGVDMTPQMLERAREIAEREGIENVEFRQSYIEELPLEDASADVVISNCVINLSADKPTVFREAYRVLKPGGRLVISDIVQERPLHVEEDCGCVSTAMLRGEYMNTIRDAGFADLELIDDTPAAVGDDGVDASAITLKAFKPSPELT